MVDLITGIVVLAIGIALMLISRAFTGTPAKILYYLGIIVAIIGAVVIVIALVGIAMLVAPLAVGLLPA